MFNNAPVVHAVGALLDPTAISMSVSRRRVKSDPCLPERLPSTGFLQREAEQLAPKEIIRQLRRSPTPSLDSDEENNQRRRRSSTSTTASASSSPSIIKSPSNPVKDSGVSWKDPQPFEVFRAVEQRDITYLMEIRDRAFPLLLRKTGDATPLLHAMRIGQSHRDVAIILVGAFSRWVNHLEDHEIVQPKTKVILKALRTNLKLAIDYGLARSQSDLIASFLQTLIMSEGDKWVTAQASAISLALRAGTAGKPVSAAQAAVRKFATKELGKAGVIASLEDYVANATADLLLLGAWSSALDVIQGEQIPAFYFARDDRIYKAFVDRLEKHKTSIQRLLGRRLKWQLRVLKIVLDGRSTTYHSKVDMLARELDEGDGV